MTAAVGMTVLMLCLIRSKTTSRGDEGCLPVNAVNGYSPPRAVDGDALIAWLITGSSSGH